MTETRPRFAARLTAAALITLSATIGFSNLSLAAPSQQDVARARARLDALNMEMDRLVEQYNQAQLRLGEVQDRLRAVQQDAAQAQLQADRAIANLNRSASRAYQGLGSQFEVLFDATSLADFSDRLEFIGNLAQADSDLANTAELAKQQAQWTADELKAAIDERQSLLEDIAANRDQIEARVEEARGLYDDLNQKYHEALAAAEAAAAARAAAAAAASTPTTTTTSPGSLSIPAPPAPNANVQTVLNAAYSVLGTPYQWGGATPESGFDCSGFTMWSWAHAGVYLPHSSAAQYSSLPHVAQEDLQPGDLLFFYDPISHVGMYVGGGRMIHSPHSGSVVSVVPVYWDSFVGASRPG